MWYYSVAKELLCPGSHIEGKYDLVQDCSDAYVDNDSYIDCILDSEPTYPSDTKNILDTFVVCPNGVEHCMITLKEEEKNWSRSQWL